MVKLLPAMWFRYSGRSISSHSDKIKGQGCTVWGNDDVLRILDVHNVTASDWIMSKKWSGVNWTSQSLCHSQMIELGYSLCMYMQVHDIS